jgi:hypothetical protein
MKSVLGIDPGVRGGVVVLRANGTVAYRCALRPEFTEKDVALVIQTAVQFLKSMGGNDAFIEKVGFIRGDGGLGAFSFGRIVGLLRGCVLTWGIQLHEVQPFMWQSKMECLTGGNKNVSKRRAIELFPEEKVTHSIADSLLIAEFGRRQFLS